MDSIQFLECWAVSLLLYIVRWGSSLLPGLKVMLGNFLYTPLGWGNVFLAKIYSKCIVLGFLASSIPVIVYQTLHLECLWTLLPVLHVRRHCQSGNPGALRSLRSTSWVWKGQADHGCYQVNRQSCANEDGEASWPSSVLGQWKYSLICLLQWRVNIIIPCFKPTEWTARMNYDGNYEVWALIGDCRLTCKYPAMAVDNDNEEDYV